MKTLTKLNIMELRRLSQRYSIEGLIIAGLFHFTLVGFIYQFTNDVPTINSGIKKDSNNIKVIVIIPDVKYTTTTPSVKVSKGSFGIPTPIPDIDIIPESLFVETNEFKSSIEGHSGMDEGTSSAISEGISINNEELPPNAFTSVEILPVPISQYFPKYPELARKAGIQGTVYIKMWVTKEGKVKKAEVVKSSSTIFDDSAVEAAKLWTFTPAIMNNTPVSVWVTIPFKFRFESN